MIGIVGYGCYIPKFRIKIEEIAKIWGRDAREIKDSLLVEEKAVADMDEDTITMAVMAGRNALSSGKIEPKDIGALFIGSESHPYIVKPSGTVVAEALGIGNELFLADLEFACKAGTTAIQICHSFVKSGEIKYGLAIGSDTAQAEPGDALEYTAASGAAGFVIGKDPLAMLEGFYSFTTDTSDFWRREGRVFPKHGARFTGEPAYFKHIISATRGLMEKFGFRTNDFDYVVFHMPNGKFPIRVAKILGFEKEKYLPGLIVTNIGNTYSASSLIGLCATLDIAEPGQRILVTSYGSGAGSDALSFLVTDNILDRRSKNFAYYVNQKEYIDYGTYAKLRGKLIKG